MILSVGIRLNLGPIGPWIRPKPAVIPVLDTSGQTRLFVLVSDCPIPGLIGKGRF